MADSDGWPEGSDLVEWLGVDSLPADSISAANGLVIAAKTRFLLWANPELTPDDDTCTEDMSIAIVMRAARVLSRRASGNGTVVLGDVVIKVDFQDPDITDFEDAYFNAPEPY